MTTYSAKRFERLLKANGISHGLVGNVKDETKQETKEEEGDDPSAPGITPKRGRPTKKRKLQQVIVNADDDDEPVKGEVKSEDAIHVKSELGNHHGGYVHLPMMTAPARLYGPSPDHLGDAHVGDANDDDDIVIVGAFENASAGIGDGSNQLYLQQSSCRHSPTSTLSAATASPRLPVLDHLPEHSANTVLQQLSPTTASHLVPRVARTPTVTRALSPPTTATTAPITACKISNISHGHHHNHHQLHYASFPSGPTNSWYHQHHHHLPHHLHHHNPSTPGIHWHAATPQPEERHDGDCDTQV